MKTEWMSIKWIRQMAEKSDEAALKCEKEFWGRLYKAKAKELRKAYMEGRFGIAGAFSAFCYRYIEENCRDCPVRQKVGCSHCDGTPYSKANEALLAWLQYKGTKRWHAWKRACELQVEFIESL